MKDQETITVYDAQAGEYAEFVQQHSADPGFESFMSWLEPGDLVLDLGCGPAHSANAMREQGMEVDPVDASAEMVKLANETFDIGARQATFEDIQSEEHYDAVWANFSLLHASTEQFPIILKALHISLKDQGVLHLGMKTGSGSHRDKLGRYYSYYSEAELTRHLETLGFEIDEVEHGEGRGLAGDLEPWIVIQSIKL